MFVVCLQGAIPSSDVAKVIGMLLQIGMQQVDDFVTVPGVVTAVTAQGEQLSVKVEGVENGVDVLLMLYCDDGGKAFVGSAVELQRSLDDMSLMMCMFRLAFKKTSVGVRGPNCRREEQYVVYGVGLSGALEVVKVDSVVEDVEKERLLGTDVRAGHLWGGGGGGTRYHSVGAKVGWLLGVRFSISETRQLIQSIVVSKTTFGVATSGVSPESLVRSDRALAVVCRLIGMDVTCTQVVAYARPICGGVGVSPLTVETLAAAGRELNVVLAGPDCEGEKLSTRESMWRVMVEWASYQYVRSEESMVVTVFELLAVYGVQVSG